MPEQQPCMTGARRRAAVGPARALPISAGHNRPVLYHGAGICAMSGCAEVTLSAGPACAHDGPGGLEPAALWAQEA